MLNAFTPSDYGDFFRDIFCNESSLAYLFVIVIIIDLKTNKLAFLIEYTDILSR